MVAVKCLISVLMVGGYIDSRFYILRLHECHIFYSLGNICSQQGSEKKKIRMTATKEASNIKPCFVLLGAFNHNAESAQHLCFEFDTSCLNAQ